MLGCRLAEIIGPSTSRSTRTPGPSPYEIFPLCFIIVGYFKLPQYIGRMYSAEGNQRPPVSGISGLWVFVPYVGTFIWIAKNQGALNEYWRAKGGGSVASVPASSTF